MGPEHQVAASFTPGGRLVFESHAHKVALWSLPLAVDEGRVRGVLQRVTEGVHLDRIPTMSVDGAALAFSRVFGEEEAIYLLDPRSGVETMKVKSRPALAYPSISPDGSRIAYWHSTALEMVSAQGSESERLASGCDFCMPEGWSHDSTSLLYVARDRRLGDAEIFVLSLKTGVKRLLAARKGYQLYQARFSPDDRWFSFAESLGDHQRIWSAQIPPSGAADPTTWVAMTPDDSWNDKPRWSPNGRLLYFISNRDGFRCIWAQRTDPESRRPIGAPFAVYHLHGARRSMMNEILENLGFDVGHDRLVFNMGEDTGNIWTTPLDPK
jgi:Tol biopolymer transport system component